MLGSMERKVLIMSIEATKKQSDLEKRLSLLRQQVHGKQEFRIQNSDFRFKNASATNHQPPTTNRSDITYLYQDLAKIGILAGLALGFQLILFFLTKNHILNLKFF